MPLPSLRPVLARFRNIFAAVLLGIVLIAGLLLVSSKEPATAPEDSPSGAVGSGDDLLPQAPDPGGADAPRLAFSTEELRGTADAATAGSLTLDLLGDGKPALLVWSSTGILLYSDGFTPVASTALESFTGVRDVSAADFNNDGRLDLCVITARGVALLANRSGSSPSFEAAGSFRGRYVQALWIDYDHDNDLDLVLLGARPLVFRNQGSAGFVPQPNAIPFVAGTAIAGAVIRPTPDSNTFDFIVSYRGRGGVLYQDRLSGRYAAQSLPELPAGAHHLRAGDFVGDAAQDFAYLLGGDAALVENLRSAWKTRKTVPAGGGFLFADFTNLGMRDWLAGGVLLAGGDAGFSQSREMATVSATTALSAADFNQDGKLDFAGVGKDGSILRYLNQTDSANRWLRIRLRASEAPRLAQGAVVKVTTGKREQWFVYGAGPLHVGTGSYPTADTIQIIWLGGHIETETNLETGKAYTFEEAQPPPVSGGAPPIQPAPSGKL